MENKTQHWIIYMYTFPNGKRYIGKTMQTLQERQKSNFVGYKSCTALWNAIQKYGIEDIEQKILFEDDMTDYQASRLEQIYILLFKTNCNRFSNPKYGYNLTDGGEGVAGMKRLDSAHMEQIRQLGYSNKGRIASKETRAKQSAAKLGRKRGPMSQETKDKISFANSKENMSLETKIRRSNSKKKKVLATHQETKEQLVFNSCTEAAIYFKVQPSAVSRWCKKTRKPLNSYNFEYLSANND